MAEKKETKKKDSKSKNSVNPHKRVIELKKEIYLHKQAVIAGEEKDTSVIKQKKREIARLLTEVNGEK